MSQRSRASITILHIVPVLCVACLMAALAMPAAASSPEGKGEPKRHAPEAESTQSVEPSVDAREGLRVVIDPETGEIITRPPRHRAEPISAPLANALSRSTEGLRVFDLPNGGKGVHLKGRFQHVLVVRAKPDGSFETVCTNHPHEAEGFLKSISTEADPRSRNK